MTTAAEIRESIHGKMVESDYLLRQLSLWEAAEAQGIDSSHGGSFGFDTRLLTKAHDVRSIGVVVSDLNYSIIFATQIIR